MKVKIFCGHNLIELEGRINDWLELEKIKTCKIKTQLQSESAYNDIETGLEWNLTITIWYEV
ncbi:MAG TPA: hypothetical protein ENI23_17785 [bacterium]|nr:hypothetical protein [bacterium]